MSMLIARTVGAGLMKFRKTWQMTLAIGLLSSLVCLTHAAHAQGAAPTGSLVLGTDQAENTYFGKWQRQVFSEVARRLGLRVTFAMFPLPRVSAAVESEEIDGEMNRTGEYGAVHPALIKV